MRIPSMVLGSTLLVAVVACQQPEQSGAAPGSGPAGGATPVAPAIEPGQPTPEHPIELPRTSPVAPAIELERPSPEPPIEYDGD